MLRPHPCFANVNVGRKGDVVFYVRNETQCMRSYKKPKDPKTPLQCAKRNLHAELTRISGRTKSFRRFCFDGKESYRNSHTAFIGLQLCQMHNSCSEDGLPVQAKIRWGMGSLPGVDILSFNWKKGAFLSWQCSKKNRTQASDSGNKVLWIAWNVNRDQWCWSLNAGKRGEKSCCPDLPGRWKGEEFYIWLLFYDPSRCQFSKDICLHVKKGENGTSRKIMRVALFSCQGLLLEELVHYWILYREKNGWEQRIFREKWFR